MDEGLDKKGKTEIPASAARDPVWTLAVAAGIVSLVLVGGTTVAVVVVLMASPAGPVPLPPLPVETGDETPGIDPEALDEAEKTMAAQRERIMDLELEILHLKERVKITEPEAVERLAERLLSGDPESVRGARAVLTQRGGNIGRVLAERILELRTRTVELEAVAEVEKKKAEAAVRDLLAQRERGEDDEAKRERERASDFYELGFKAQESGHHALAETQYTRALKFDPAMTSALNGRGMVRLELADAAGALEDFTTASSLKRDYAPFRFNRGRALMALGRWGDAMEAFDRVLRLDPGNTEALKAKEDALKRLDNG